MSESPSVQVTSPALELDETLSLELDEAFSLELDSPRLELDSTALLELGALELELSSLLLELDSMPESLSHGQPDSVTLSPLHPAQKKAVVVSKRFFQCLRMFILAPLHRIFL
jgi:hypothetical protein